MRHTCFTRRPPIRGTRAVTRASRGGMRERVRVAKSLGKRPFEGGVCTSITAKTISEAREQVKIAKELKADLVEFRLDFLDRFRPERDLEVLLGSCEMPYIVTYRPIWEGGQYDGNEDRRLAVLKECSMIGAPFVDVELKAAKSFFSGSDRIGEDTEVILSHHDFKQTPSLKELNEVVQRMRDEGADIAKIATLANDITDCHRLITLLKEQTLPAVVLGMGERGLMTRMLAPKYGGFLTFGALSSGQESAPGQPTIQSLRDLYRIQDIQSSTKVFGVIGNPISHSKSPHFHNACFHATGFDAVYLPLLVDDFQHFVDTFKDSDFAGYSVTVPHKEAALKAAEEVDAVTAGIGACNTLIRSQSGGFRGRNTDWSAAMDIIESALSEADEPAGSLKGKTMVVVGAGGVAKALAYGGASRGAEVIIANRTTHKAVLIAERIPHCSAVALEDVQDGKVKGDVLVNGTSLGMEPLLDASPVPKEVLNRFKLVFDAVYTPKETKLLREAAEVGCRTASGVGMFIGQAKQQFELFTGTRAPSDVAQI